MIVIRIGIPRGPVAQERGKLGTLPDTEIR